MSRRKLVSWNAIAELAGVADGAQDLHGSRIGNIISPITAADPSMYPRRSSKVSYAGDGQVHRHRPQEPSEASGSMSNARDGVHDGLEHRVVRVAAVRGRRRTDRRSPSRARRVGARYRSEVVDDVVGVPAEAVEGVNVVPLHARQHHRRPVVRRTVAPVEASTLHVALLQRHAHGVPRPRRPLEPLRRWRSVARIGAGSSRNVHRADAGGGELSRHQHHRHADARDGRRPDEDEPGTRLSTLHGQKRRRSGGTCGRGRTACPAPSPTPPSRAGRRSPR